MFAVDPCVAENRLAAYCGLRTTLPLLSPPTCSQPAALLIVHEIAIKLLETRRSLVDGKKRSIAMCNDTQGRLRPKIASEALNVSETSSLMGMTGSWTNNDGASYHRPYLYRLLALTSGRLCSQRRPSSVVVYVDHRGTGATVCSLDICPCTILNSGR